MIAYTYSLSDLFSFQRRWVIPTFQRDYEWTKAGQWELLFEDLEDTIGRLEKAQKMADVTGVEVAALEASVGPHFLGAVVVDDLPRQPGGFDPFAVIDGQQRMTTLQLLLRGVLDALIDRDSPWAGQVRLLLENPSGAVADPDHVHKLWPRRRDRDVWRQAMSDERTTGKHPYLEARAYFGEMAAEAMAGPDGENRELLVVDALSKKFKLVVIHLEPNDDAQVIFEALNGRQTKLTAMDLVKNLLFLRAEVTDEAKLEELYSQHWARFDDPWWRKTVGRGHAARERRDVLLSAWLVQAATAEVNIGHLYGEVRSFVLTERPKIEDVLADIGAAADAFRVVFDRPAELPERLSDAYRRVLSQEVTTALPLLVWMRMLPMDRFSEEEHIAAAAAVDSFIVRRLLVGVTSRGYSTRWLGVLEKAKAAAETPDERIGDAIINALSETTTQLHWPTDTELLNSFRTRDLYRLKVGWVLGAIDRQMHLEHPKGELPTFDYSKLQVEHVLPQAWSNHWMPEEFTQEQINERNLAMNRIGNLTLLTGPLNGAQSDDPWEKKRPALADHSNLRLNAELVKEDEWDEARIAARADRLAAIAYRIWPGPRAMDD